TQPMAPLMYAPATTKLAFGTVSAPKMGNAPMMGSATRMESALVPPVSGRGMVITAEGDTVDKGLRV
ncbi:MAG: hypothetical protein RR590_11190, partial [Hungatella sp.]